MPIVKKNEAMPERNVLILVYGDAGAGKTSLANTSKKPLLIDCDRGADRAGKRGDTLVCRCWEDILSSIPDMKDYDTIIVDTAKAMLDDYMMVYAKQNNETAAKNTQKAYGVIGDMFKDFVANLQKEGKDIIFIAHDKPEKEGDDGTTHKPDITGQSYNLILRKVDQIGYLGYTDKNERCLFFSHSKVRVNKDTADMGDVIIPNISDKSYDTYMSLVISSVKKAISKKTNEQVIEQESITAAKEAIGNVSDADSANLAYAAILKCSPTYQKELNKALAEKTKPLSLAFDRKANKFI